ncbi:hypothetical protein [Lysobacter brunescens]|uniref:Uncharacterized protein n=1 Tax=Lysobacter brunescens TaxID=262323 RepID=A0ABW2YFN9_9GAMM
MNPNETAAIPVLKWLRIVEYGSFHDVPRSMLVLDRDMAFWIFDSGFDDAIDDYSDQLMVYGIGHDAAAARDAFRVRDADGNIQGFKPLDTIAMNRVEFDETRRNAMFIHKGLAYPKRTPSRFDGT